MAADRITASVVPARDDKTTVWDGQGPSPPGVLVFRFSGPPSMLAKLENYLNAAQQHLSDPEVIFEIEAAALVPEGRMLPESDPVSLIVYTNNIDIVRRVLNEHKEMMLASDRGSLLFTASRLKMEDLAK